MTHRHIHISKLRAKVPTPLTHNNLSKFNKTHIVSVKTENGRLTINDRDYKEFTGDAVTFVEENMSDERIKVILKDKFGLTVN